MAKKRSSEEERLSNQFNEAMKEEVGKKARAQLSHNQTVNPKDWAGLLTGGRRTYGQLNELQAAEPSKKNGSDWFSSLIGKGSKEVLEQNVKAVFGEK